MGPIEELVRTDDFVHYALMTDKQAQSVPYLVRDSFVFTAYPTVSYCSCGGTTRRTTLERSRQKNNKIFRLRSRSSLASFLLGIFLTILHQPVARKHKQYRRHLNRSRFLAIDMNTE